MKSIVKEELGGLIQLFENSFRRHLEELEGKGYFGFALDIGEGADQLFPSSITQREEELSDPKDAYLRYTPSEWENWWNEPFLEFTKEIQGVFELFQKRADLSASWDENSEFSLEEADFYGDVMSIYLETMKALAESGAFGSMQYRIIWVADSEYPIILRSLSYLNDESVIEAAMPALDFLEDV